MSLKALDCWNCPSRKCKGRLSLHENGACIHCGRDRLAATRSTEPLPTRSDGRRGKGNRGPDIVLNEGRERLKRLSGNDPKKRKIAAMSIPDYRPARPQSTVFGRRGRKANTKL